jgi:hypothetical protein
MKIKLHCENDDPELRQTIGINYSRGNHFTVKKSEDEKMIDSYMFFMARESEGFSHYLDSDFVILKVDIERKAVGP